MSSTVETNRRTCVAEIDGKPIYSLWSKNYYADSSTRTPRWNCCFIGDTSSSVRAIFSTASAYVNGTIKSKDGKNSPEEYLQSAIQSLSAPVGIAEAKGNSYLSLKQWVDSKVVNQALDILRKHGCVIARDGGFNLDLQKDAAIVGELFQTCKEKTWHLFDEPLPQQAASQKLGYAPEKSDVHPALPCVYAIGANKDPDLLVARPNGQWEMFAGTKADSSALMSYVERYWETELVYPGHFADSIGRFREACQNAQPVPAGTTLVFDLASVRGEPSQSFQEAVDRHRDALTHQGVVVRPVGRTLVFDLSGINSNYQRLPWEIRELSETLPAKWMVPTADLFEHTKTIGCNGSGSKPSKKPEKPGMGI